jgi:hypothetical protein
MVEYVQLTGKLDVFITSEGAILNTLSVVRFTFGEEIGPTSGYGSREIL